MRDDKAVQAAFHEAERRYGAHGGVSLYPGAVRQASRIAFEKGAAWQRAQPVEITDEMVERAYTEWVSTPYDGEDAIRAALEAALNTATTPAADHVHDDFGDCCAARAREKWRAEHPGEEPENVSRLNGKHS
jgi:hypothetical protein